MQVHDGIDQRQIQKIFERVEFFLYGWENLRGFWDFFSKTQAN